MTLPPDCALHLFGDLSRLTADGEPPGSLTLALHAGPPAWHGAVCPARPGLL